ncbi:MULTISPECIES: P-type conjugative transfer protein TrbJ [unclassified Rhizobium]|uniref:P-type conjugative transfer protein TrbJ n=1 Tax=unclassified Rhizobium TaxID=2613769 RepID=UPI000CDF4394|nr:MULTISPECIES: P-type conjugative transfer protein TrbJ [Rhizobium]AVA24440.1 conjugal transfer protein TrbJ [Rhizobium sp. NXC24]UWU25609.1 P-type conjugative transfer protein TrbJ [Rhizobium tropici]
MPQRCSTSNRLLAGLAAVALMAGAVVPANAGTATGAATEWTQVLNNGELVALVGKSGEQIQNQLTQISQLAQQIETQLNIYQNLLQNTATLPSHMWGQVESDLNQLRSIVDGGQSISFSMGNADDVLQQRFQSYSSLKTNLPDNASFSTAYQSWSDTNRDTIASTLKAASLTAEQFDNEEGTMASLRSMSETADGQMKALQVGHEIAAQQIAQMQKLRALVSQQMTMMGTWFQTEQTDKDLAQARREKFFSGTAPSTSGGEKMKVEW